MTQDKPPIPLSKQLDVPPLWLIGALALSWILHRVMPLFQWGGGWSAAIGWILIAAAFVLFVWSVDAFRRHETPIHPRRKPKALLTTGPYALSRNPIYLAMAMIALGTACLFGSLGALLPVPVFVWVIGKRFIEGEEFHIGRNFGEQWTRYTQQTRRWF